MFTNFSGKSFFQDSKELR